MDQESEEELTRHKYKAYILNSNNSRKTIPRRTMYRLKKQANIRIASLVGRQLPMRELQTNGDMVLHSNPPSILAQSRSSGDEDQLKLCNSNAPSYSGDDEDTFSSHTSMNCDGITDNIFTSDEELKNNGDNETSAPLQQASSVSKKAVLCMALKHRHKLTDVACNDILSLINVCANEQVVPKNQYQLKNSIGKYACTEIHHICPNHMCESYVGIVDEGLQNVICDICSTRFVPKINVKEGNFFLHVSLTDQLKVILESHTEEELGWEKGKRVNCYLTDVCSGKLYKNTCTNKQDLSISFSCDGVPVFSSSGFSMWPILCTVNEFSSYQRKQNIMLPSLWFGRNKPDMNTFLKPFVAESKILAEHGLSYQMNGVQQISKVFVVIGVCDSVARPLLQCSTQFNGLYGCGFCLHPGEVVPKGRGHTRVYCYQANTALRNHVDTTEHMRLAIAESTPKFGIKEPSILLDIPNFDIVEGLVPDYMHSVLLGICRQFMSLWIDSKNHQQPYYIGNRIHDIDVILLSFEPPLFVSRTPRSLKERKFWKAHEWYVWLFYYSIPTLKGILPDRYVNHWGWLVTGMYILLQESITKSDVVIAERVLIPFVKHVEILYGKENSSFNVHLCEHLPKSVENWGPLHAHSAFLYEDYNSELLESIRSSNGVPLQIVDVFQAKLAMLKLTRAFLPSMTSEERTFLSSVDSTVKGPIKNSVAVSDSIHALGLPKHCQLSDVNFYALQKYHVEINRSSCVAYYDRVVINHEMIHSQSYKRVSKRNSYTVMVKDGNIFEIKNFLVHSNHCYAIGRYFKKIKHNYFSRDLKNYTDLEYLIALEDINDSSAVDVNDIVRKVVCLGSPNPAYILVCVPPNNLEMLK